MQGFAGIQPTQRRGLDAERPTKHAHEQGRF
jgi:hypothetical protein